MILDRIDPPELAPIPATTHATIAKGDTIIHISGQTGVDVDGQVVGPTLGAQAGQALRNLRTVVESTGATLADVAKITIYVVNYGPDSLEALMGAAIEVLGEEFPIAASTLLGVSTLWQPELLVEIDAVVVM